MSNYKKMMGYGDKKKVTKKQTKPKKNQILEGIKTELKEWDSIKSSPKRWSKTFDGNTGLTEYEQGKVYTDKDRPPFKTEAQIQEGPSYEYAKHIKKIDKNYEIYWKSVKDFQRLLDKKGLKGASKGIGNAYKNLVVKFHKLFEKVVRKLM
tara:strand:+ start:143 stop:595 length:453 start_codon:yes stop_codon:yes gene_type:complete